MAFLDKLSGFAKTAGEKAAEAAKVAGEKAAEAAKVAGEKAAEAAKVAGEKANTAIELGKLNVKVKSEENEIENIKLALGQLVWEQFLTCDELPEDQGQLCREIRSHQEVISGLRNQIAQLKEKPEDGADNE